VVIMSLPGIQASRPVDPRSGAVGLSNVPTACSNLFQASAAETLTLWVDLNHLAIQLAKNIERNPRQWFLLL